MLAPVNAPTPIRSIGYQAPQVPVEVCLGVPTCAPIVQHQLLNAIREQIPHAYERAGRELGMTISKSSELIRNSPGIVSSAGAIRLARLIAYEPNARNVFTETGYGIFEDLDREIPRLVKASIRRLPRPLRVRSAIALTRNLAYGFAGGLNRIYVDRDPQGIVVSLVDGIFSERLDTIGCAGSYYRAILESILQQMALIECDVRIVKTSRVYLRQCDLRIVWEA